MEVIDYTVSFQDERGIIVDFIANQNINAVTLITFTKDSVRGNHEHKKTWQWNYLIKGELEVVTQVGDGPVQKQILQEKGLFLISPLEKHALKALCDCEILVFTKGPRGGKEYENDTYRLEEPLISEVFN